MQEEEEKIDPEKNIYVARVIVYIITGKVFTGTEKYIANTQPLF